MPGHPSYLVPALPDTMGWDQPSHYGNIFYGDINGDGADEMVARGVAGTEVFRYISNLGQWSQMAVPAILPTAAAGTRRTGIARSPSATSAGTIATAPNSSFAPTRG